MRQFYQDLVSVVTVYRSDSSSSSSSNSALKPTQGMTSAVHGCQNTDQGDQSTLNFSLPQSQEASSASERRKRLRWADS